MEKTPYRDYLNIDTKADTPSVIQLTVPQKEIINPTFERTIPLNGQTQGFTVIQDENHSIDNIVKTDQNNTESLIIDSKRNTLKEIVDEKRTKKLKAYSWALWIIFTIGITIIVILFIIAIVFICNFSDKNNSMGNLKDVLKSNNQIRKNPNLPQDVKKSEPEIELRDIPISNNPNQTLPKSILKKTFDKTGEDNNEEILTDAFFKKYKTLVNQKSKKS